MNINVNYHSSIKIDDIYVDPFKIEKKVNDARYIFITHSHYDHLSIEDIDKVINENTILVGPKDVCDILKETYNNKIIEVLPNEKYDFFETFPSYNINKRFHPRSNNWVGYIIELDNLKYIVIGDSDLTDELKELEGDVLFVPIGGTYTMDSREASELANIIKPKLVIPVHYNGIVGNKNDEKDFISRLNNVECKIFL